MEREKKDLNLQLQEMHAREKSLSAKVIYKNNESVTYRLMKWWMSVWKDEWMNECVDGCMILRPFGCLIVRRVNKINERVYWWSIVWIDGGVSVLMQYSMAGGVYIL